MYEEPKTHSDLENEYTEIVLDNCINEQQAVEIRDRQNNSGTLCGKVKWMLLPVAVLLVFTPLLVLYFVLPNSSEAAGNTAVVTTNSQRNREQDCLQTLPKYLINDTSTRSNAFIEFKTCIARYNLSSYFADIQMMKAAKWQAKKNTMNPVCERHIKICV